MQELINHPATVESLSWASLENLERAINRAASLWPLEIDMLTPQTLNLWLDKAGIKHRIIVISACYSGSLIAPLRNENTLIMTAANATPTSFGCGSGSELTFFGRALCDEALLNTYSFEEAFQHAIPVIRERERQAGKTDGPSNPQIYIGEKK